MKKINFLGKLRKTGKLGIVEPSNEIKESYLIKSDNCLRSAKILSQNTLYENAVTEAYYAMHNCLLALLYLAGIKVLINKLNNSDIAGIRIAFENLFKEKKVV